MVFADDIRRIILKIADERGTERSFGASDVAQAVDRENWQSLIDQVALVASILEKEGKIRTRYHGDRLDFVKTDKPSSTKKSA